MSSATVESNVATTLAVTISDKRRRNVDMHATLTSLSASSLQLCASFLGFREQRVLVGTCVHAAAAIDHRHSIAYAPRVEYPYGHRSTACDAIVAAIARNRTPRLAFLGLAHECLWGAHWAHLCTSMSQLRHLSLALGVVTQTQFDAVTRLQQLETLALQFNERSPSLAVLLDGVSLPKLDRLSLQWPIQGSYSVSLHMILLSRSCASPRTYRSALDSSSSSPASSVAAAAAASSLVTTMATRARPSWLCAPGPHAANFLLRTKEWWRHHDRDDRRPAIAGTADALEEVDRLCPLLWLCVATHFRMRVPLFVRWEPPAFWTANPLPPFLSRRQ